MTSLSLYLAKPVEKIRYFNMDNNRVLKMAI